MTEEVSSRREFLHSTTVTGLLTAGVGAELWWISQSLQQEDIDKTYLLGGQTQGWEGFAPAEISGTTNPTLKLEPGRTYRILWKNLDGVPHNFQIRNTQGNPMEVLIPLTVKKTQVNELFQRAQQKTLENVSIANATDLPANVTYVNQTGNVTANVAVSNQTTANETGERTIDIVKSTKLVSQQGAIQGVQFTATEDMARYICVVHPTTMIGDIEIGPGETGGNINSTTNNTSQ